MSNLNRIFVAETASSGNSFNHLDTHVFTDPFSFFDLTHYDRCVFPKLPSVSFPMSLARVQSEPDLRRPFYSVETPNPVPHVSMNRSFSHHVLSDPSLSPHAIDKNTIPLPLTPVNNYKCPICNESMFDHPAQHFEWEYIGLSSSSGESKGVERKCIVPCRMSDQGGKKTRIYRKIWIAAKRHRGGSNCSDLLNSNSDSDSELRTTHRCDDVQPSSFGTEKLRSSSEAQAVWDEIDNHRILSSDSEDESTDIGLDVSCLESDLVKWVNTYQIKHNATEGILAILRNRGYPDLPVTARTLLNTDINVKTVKTTDYEYFFLGLKTELLKNLNKYPNDISKYIDNVPISFNIDGLPLFKSSQKSLWPVLCAICIEPKIVFPVAFTLCNGKPSNLEFLSDTIDELEDILTNGFQYEDRTLKVLLKGIICDAPARAMVKCCKLYSGYYGCERCTQRGHWVGRICYPDVDNLIFRTDASFRRQEQSEHHRGVSPFCLLEMDMVKDFPIDYMHQICLGVMKRLLLLWIRGKRDVRMSAGHVDEIGKRLLSMRNIIPEVFARKPRSLREIDRWKATEYRQFLLYTGKLVLKGILRQDLYDHFMKLSCAVCLLVGKTMTSESLGRAHQLLIHFVKKGKLLYGDEFLVYNVHMLTHIASDAETFGSLDTFSAFAFESYLQKVKRLVRSGKSPLVQIVRRLKEQEASLCSKAPALGAKSYKRPNNAFVLENGNGCIVVGKNNEGKCLCRVYSKPHDLFNRPIASRIIGVFKVSAVRCRMRVLPENELKRKALVVEGDDTSLFMAILHEY